MEMTGLERQQASFKWLQQQLNHNNYLNQNYPNTETCPMPRFPGLLDHQSVTSGDIVEWNKKNKPGLYMGNSDLIRYGSVCIAAGGGTKFLADKMGLTQAEAVTHPGKVDHCLSSSSSCQVGALEVAKMEEEVVEVGSGDVDVSLVEEMRSKHGGDVLNKRKAELVEAEESKEKRTKGEIEVESQMQSTNQISAESSKENERSSAAQKQDYIHVRARRGQATDSHSLAERARREKISKKMKYLQDLVPGCNKITGRARMLDEIINYVQSLQRQVEFLSMKLAALTPRQELDIDTFSGKVLPAYVASFPASNLSPAIASLPRLLLNVVQQQATGIEPELPINPSEILHEITTRSSMFMPELCPDSSSCFSQLQSFWDSNPQNLHKFGFHQG